jgi:hypothetical protein
MNIKTVSAGSIVVSEIISDEVLLRNEQDAVNLLSEGLSDHIIIREQNVVPDFFDLSTRVAGDILQKFSTYHTYIAIVGDFEKYPSKTLKDFIYECNKTRDHIFVKSRDEAIKMWEK